MPDNIVVLPDKLAFCIAADIAKLIVYKSYYSVDVSFGDNIAFFNGFFILF
jgi:hypothetical protein